MTNKIYPDDYTEEQRKIIKEIVIARLRQLPDNFRICMGGINDKNNF